MLSLLDRLDRVRRNESEPDAELRIAQHSINSAERFLSHSALAIASLQAARDHLIDALRAIDHADPQVLLTFVEVSGLLRQSSGIPLAVVKFAMAMIERKQWTTAFEAIGQAVLFDAANQGELTHDESAWANISSAFDVASRTLGRSVHAGRHGGGPLRVGFLTSQLKDNSPTEQFLAGWVRHANADLASLRVYVTESAAKPLRHGLKLAAAVDGSARTGARIIGELKARRIEPWLSPSDAEAIQTSRMLTERIVRDQIELLLVDSTLADAAVGITVAGRPAAQQIAIRRGAPVPISGIDEVIDVSSHLISTDSQLLQERGIRSRPIFQGIDVSTSSAAPRRDYGLSDSAIVMMSCCDDPERQMTSPFVKMVARLLAENPRAVYLLAGEGDLAGTKSIFESAGVAKRVGYASQLKDAAAFVGMADVYLAEFPSSSRGGVLTAMSTGKPVMILAGEYDQPSNARFVGSPYAVVGSPATLLDRCSAMLRDSQLRTSVGTSLQRRAKEKFSIQTTIDEFMRIAVQVLSQRAKDVESAALHPNTGASLKLVA